MAAPRIPLADRFWSKVLKTESCWLWQRQVNNKGYGCFAFYSKTLKRKSTNMYAHRVAWLLTNGTIPEGMNVLHKCDTPACVNPAHMFLGTQADNMQDCKRKGRTCKYEGENHPLHRLTEDDVRSIRLDSRTHAEIAKTHNISRGFVNSIKHRHTWKHLA